MRNSFFRFKQFTVHQEHCAMKVCTDACLFGAWIAGETNKLSVNKVLDIGTGTGLLSLMYAQQHADTLIDAIEIDEAAAKQAADNFKGAPWHQNLHVHHTPIQNFKARKEEENQLYDLIISNPPFFENDLKSNNDKRNLALHSAALNLDELLDACKQFLQPAGLIAVLLPYHRSASFIISAKEKGWQLNKEINVKQTTKHTYFRSMLLFSTTATELQQEEIIIRDNDVYTPAFAALLNDYYL